MPMSPEQVADLTLRLTRDKTALRSRAEAAEARVRELEEQLHRAGIKPKEVPADAVVQGG